MSYAINVQNIRRKCSGILKLERLRWLSDRRTDGQTDAAGDDNTPRRAAGRGDNTPRRAAGRGVKTDGPLTRTGFPHDHLQPLGVAAGGGGLFMDFPHKSVSWREEWG